MTSQRSFYENPAVLKFISDNTLIYLLATFFFVKVLVLGFWITPLWDIPDEPGHYSYLQDIAHGKGLPKLGTTVISANIVRHWYRNTTVRLKVE